MTRFYVKLLSALLIVSFPGLPVLGVDSSSPNSVQDIIEEDREETPKSASAGDSGNTGALTGGNSAESNPTEPGNITRNPESVEDAEAINAAVREASPELSTELGEARQEDSVLVESVPVESVPVESVQPLVKESEPRSIGTSPPGPMREFPDSPVEAESIESSASLRGPDGSPGESPPAAQEKTGLGNTESGNTLSGNTVEGGLPEASSVEGETEREGNSLAGEKPGSDAGADPLPPPMAEEIGADEDPPSSDEVVEGETPAPPESLPSGMESNRVPEEEISVANRIGEETQQELFPTTPGIEKQKEFWIQIFTHYNSHQGVLHDKRVALPVYEDLDLPGLSYRSQMRHIRKAKRNLVGRLRKLAAVLEADDPLEEKQEELLAKLPEDSSPAEIRNFARNVRFQRGLSDRFRQGIIRSGAILKTMQEILVQNGVPADLAYLPHVESTFNNKTRSRSGAVGIWQFTRGTGALYMKVGYEIDERLDPIIACRSAAKFLLQNYEKLGNWPLAITAYNHGPQSLLRITKRLGTRNLGALIENYNGRMFKFASKNFYAEFLAAREVATHYQDYFGELELDPILEFEEVTLPFYVAAKEVSRTLGILQKQLKKLNPALRYPIWSGSKFIPKGYTLRIPKGSPPEQFLASVPDSQRMKRQKRASIVRVARGDSLYRIGKRLGIPWRKIALANNITGRTRLYPGQKLVIPWNGKVPPAVLAKLNRAKSRRKPAPLANVVARMPPPDQPRPSSTTNTASITAFGDKIISPGFPTTASNNSGNSSRFQELRVVNFDSDSKDGEIIAAYGETLGLYANWAEVTVYGLRNLNGMYSRSRLHPGRRLIIPLDNVLRETFDQRRLTFHQEREANFFAENDITAMVKVEVQLGQSPWKLAQNNNVPMWLFYRENPTLIDQPMLPGMKIVLPIVEEGNNASKGRSGAGSGAGDATRNATGNSAGNGR